MDAIATRKLDIVESQLDAVLSNLKKLETHFVPKQPTTFLTRKEAADILNVTLPTIDDWRETGVLKAYRLGNKVYFKRHELETALVPIKKGGRNEN